MLDIKLIRTSPEKLRTELKNRRMKFDFDALVSLDQQHRLMVTELDNARAQQNRSSDAIATMKGDERASAIAEVKTLKEKISGMEKEFAILDAQLHELLAQLPNISHESTPVGADASSNVVLKTVGIKPEFSFAPLSHYEIPSVSAMMDFERGAKVSGNRFWYLKGKLAQLDIALMHYALDFYVNKGFEAVIPPMLVREDAMFGTGFFPADRNEIYTVNHGEDNLFLVGTAEVPLAAYHRDEVLDFSAGAKKYAGISSCFRREAGAYGKDMKGILRGHQFQKVEMFVFCKPDESWQMHEVLLACAEEFLQSLELHYQVLTMCTGDIGAPNAKKYDIETWMPGQQSFRETNSCSNDTDFQARRLNCRYADAKGTLQFVHTLNNTACADLRTLIALLENNQQEDGSVVIPKVLQPYAGFEKI